MTDYYGAFSTSTSRFLGQIWSTNIDTSYKSILTCLSNNEKIENIIWAKMLPRLCSPTHLPSPPSWGWVMGTRVSAESHPHRSNALLLQSLYVSGKKPHLLPCGSISFSLTRRSLVLVPSLFRSSAVVNLHFSCPKSVTVLSSCYFSDDDRFKAGVHVKAVFMSLNPSSLSRSRSRLKQR